MNGKDRQDEDRDEELERLARESRMTGGDAPAAGSIAEREAVAEGGDGFTDDDEEEDDGGDERREGEADEPPGQQDV